MLIRSLRLPHAIVLATGFLCLEAVGLALFRNDLVLLWATIFGAYILAECLCFALCYWRARQAVYLRRHWILLTIACFLHVLAYLLRAWIVLVSRVIHHQFNWRIDYTDLLILSAYIPAFILISLPSGKGYPRLFFWIDAIQAIVASYLAYIKLFSVIPFTHGLIRPLSIVHTANFYNVVNLALAGAATLRLFASITEDERRFYRAYCWYVWIGSILIGLQNALVTHSGGDWGGLLNLAALMLFYLLFFYLPAEGKEPVPVTSPKLLTIFLDTASPAFFTFSLLALGIDISRQYFAFGMGAIVAAFLAYGLRVTVLQSRYQQSQRSLQEARDKLEDLSLKDALTGVANRRCFNQTLELEWSRAIRLQHPLSLLLIDIDYFKNLNDRYGHRSGDECLVQVAAALCSVLPGNDDLLARYGGEEFAVILPDTDQAAARDVAAKMREAIDALRIDNETGIGHYASISVGIGSYISPYDGSPSLLLEASDRALYQAKQKGRNRIELAAMPFFPDNIPVNA